MRGAAIQAGDWIWICALNGLDNKAQGNALGLLGFGFTLKGQTFQGVNNRLANRCKGLNLTGFQPC
jgi:hypothetical protein